MPLVAHDLEQRVGGDVGYEQRLATREHLLDLGIFREVDGQVTQLLVVAGCHDVAHVAALAHEDDAHTVDLGYLGDALDDGEEDAAKIEVRRERLRELEDQPCVLFLLGERLDDAMETELAAHAGHQLDRLEGLAHEVVGAGLERAGHFLVRLERGQDDDGHVARLRARAQDAQHLVAVRRRHDQVEQHNRGIDFRRAARAPRHRMRPRHEAARHWRAPGSGRGD